MYTRPRHHRPIQSLALKLHWMEQLELKTSKVDAPTAFEFEPSVTECGFHSVRWDALMLLPACVAFPLGTQVQVPLGHHHAYLPAPALPFVPFAAQGRARTLDLHLEHLKCSTGQSSGA